LRGDYLSEIPQQVIDDLVNGEMYLFSDWPNDDLPDIAIGIYAIWKGDDFAYVGIAGRSLQSADYQMKSNKKKGLKQRLGTHWKGGLGGDQFCVYVFERFLCDILTTEDLKQMVNKEVTLAELNRDYIRNNLSYRFTILDSYKDALAIETRIKKGEIEHIGKPYLNELSG